jgi:hypothetical protein
LGWWFCAGAPLAAHPVPLYLFSPARRKTMFFSTEPPIIIVCLLAPLGRARRPGEGT